MNGYLIGAVIGLVLGLIVFVVLWLPDRRARRAMDEVMFAQVMAELEAISPDWRERERERRERPS